MYVCISSSICSLNNLPLGQHIEAVYGGSMFLSNFGTYLLLFLSFFISKSISSISFPSYLNYGKTFHQHECQYLLLERVKKVIHRLTDRMTKVIRWISLPNSSDVTSLKTLFVEKVRHQISDGRRKTCRVSVDTWQWLHRPSPFCCYWTYDSNIFTPWRRILEASLPPLYANPHKMWIWWKDQHYQNQSASY